LAAKLRLPNRVPGYHSYLIVTSSFQSNCPPTPNKSAFKLLKEPNPAGIEWCAGEGRSWSSSTSAIARTDDTTRQYLPRWRR